MKEESWRINTRIKSWWYQYRWLRGLLEYDKRCNGCYFNNEYTFQAIICIRCKERRKEDYKKMLIEKEKTPIDICFEKLVEYFNRIIIMHNIYPTPETKKIVDLLREYRRKVAL